MKANNTTENRVKCYGDNEMNAKAYELREAGFNRVENAYWVEHWQKGNELVILERCDESKRPATPETPNPENTPATMNANDNEYLDRLRADLQEYHNNASKGGANRQRNMTMLAEDIARLEASANEITVTVHQVAPGHWQASANGVKFGWVCTWDHGTFAACMNIGIREQKALAPLDLWNEQRGTYGHKAESAAVASLSEMITSYFAKYGYTAKVLNA